MNQSYKRAKILCIDDTSSSRRLVQRLLFSKYEFFEATDGLSGIDRAVTVKPDLVLVDLHMPHFTGYEVATRIKALLPDVPIIALTADMTEHVRERVLASGCDGYIAKPIDPDTFVEQVEEFLGGQREELEDESYREAYQNTLVARLEEKVRELTETMAENEQLNRQNLQLLERAQRRTHLLEAAAHVGQTVTSILNLDELLSATVEIICEEFGFYYAGVFLVDETKNWAVLHAGHGDAGKKMVENGHRLYLHDVSMIAAAIRTRKPRIAFDVGEDPVHFKNPLLPLTRSEVALPLVVADAAIGAVTVQSVEESAFDDDDIIALQVLCDQLAVAINNARLLRDLEAAHSELVRTKTYEAIATATGEAIHWVGNKAAPIPGSVARITEDVVSYLVMANRLVQSSSPEFQEHPFAQMFMLAVEQMVAHGMDLQEIEARLEDASLRRLRRVLSVESIFEDLAIIEGSAKAILNIKEDLIGPARKKRVQIVELPALLDETIKSMGISKEVARTLYGRDLLPVRADRVQLGRVFINLMKNAMEAMHNVSLKRLFIWARRADDPNYVVVDVTDSGEGIPGEQIDKIWMAFYTTKGDRGGTGLGLPACAQIIGDLGGKITVQSEVGAGTTFSVFLPAFKETSETKPVEEG
ncbi:MAG: response regulator [Anaerolineae bacterium]|nr:response regulator [Anaerolineae bacterium]